MASTDTQPVFGGGAPLDVEAFPAGSPADQTGPFRDTGAETTFPEPPPYTAVPSPVWNGNVAARWAAVRLDVPSGAVWEVPHSDDSARVIRRLLVHEGTVKVYVGPTETAAQARSFPLLVPAAGVAPMVEMRAAGRLFVYNPDVATQTVCILTEWSVAAPPWQPAHAKAADVPRQHEAADRRALTAAVSTLVALLTGPFPQTDAQAVEEGSQDDGETFDEAGGLSAPGNAWRGPQRPPRH